MAMTEQPGLDPAALNRPRCPTCSGEVEDLEAERWVAAHPEGLSGYIAEARARFPQIDAKTCSRTVSAGAWFVEVQPCGHQFAGDEAGMLLIAGEVWRAANPQPWERRR